MRTPISRLLAQRFEVQKTIGKGSFGTTYSARDRHTGELVAVKEMNLDTVDNWKAIELFEREAQTLETLDHPGIPNYVDFIPAADENRAYLAQELSPGSTLEVLLRAQGPFPESRLRPIAEQLLEILIYLDSRRPPVIHRDIKPANILLDSQDHVHLVDFGSVVDIANQMNSSGSTVTGTFGYMAPEQLHGAATTASDLFSLGMTLIHLVTGRRPEDLERQRMKVQFRPLTPNISPQFATFLERLTEPAVEDRFRSAQEALQFLQEPPPEASPLPAAENTSSFESALEVREGKISTPRTKLPFVFPLTTLLRIGALVFIALLGFDAFLQVLPTTWESYPVWSIFFFIGVAPAVLGVIILPFWSWWRSRDNPLKYTTQKTTGVVTGRFIHKDEDGDFRPWIGVRFRTDKGEYLCWGNLQEQQITEPGDLTKLNASAELQTLSEGDTVPVYYSPGDEEFASLHESNGVGMSFLDFLIGIWVSYSAIFALINFSYSLTGTWTHTTHGSNLSSDAFLESVFLLPFSTTLPLMLGGMALFVATIFFDRFDHRYAWTSRRPKPTPEPLSFPDKSEDGCFLLIIFILATFLAPGCIGGAIFAVANDTVSLPELSVESRFHPENPTRLDMRAEKRADEDADVESD